MKKIEETVFTIIAYAGSAKSFFLEALETAKSGNYEKAKQIIKEGDREYKKAHKSHFQIVQESMSNEDMKISMLMIHAEDILMNAETIKILVEELIYMHEKYSTEK